MAPDIAKLLSDLEQAASDVERLDAQLKKATADRQRIALELYRAGVSPGAIAKLAGFSEARLFQLAQRDKKA